MRDRRAVGVDGAAAGGREISHPSVRIPKQAGCPSYDGIGGALEKGRHGGRPSGLFGGRFDGSVLANHKIALAMGIPDFHEPWHLRPLVGFVRLCRKQCGNIMNQRPVFFRFPSEKAGDRWAFPGFIRKTQVLSAFFQPPFLLLLGSDRNALGELGPAFRGITGKRDSEIAQIVLANNLLCARREGLNSRKEHRNENEEDGNSR